ncbi:hypothetical protein HV241_15985 [Citrobacter freundii]|jgi:hypothetical protein|uniref:hypothetical protein n=2 Tax=Citrobacter freundii TaxID=546 RepID=UPI0010938664|nr:hypothetical protein [Citrobacter freundii]MBA7731017.1 hypothetical protein [Citrobacter freundii]QCA17529.1 hypothetical protein E5284_06450 [Citrobacter freundii]QLY70454.1 hypothetical protein HV241_15985 [Citrobacter freundii]
MLNFSSIVTITLAILLTGCCVFIKNKINFASDILPVASVGRNYHAQLKTTGLPADDMSVDGRSMLSTNGLNIISYSIGGFWHIDISGIPEKKGEFSFWVSGSTVGTQCPGSDFKEKFTVIVIDSKKEKDIPVNLIDDKKS